MSLMYMVVEMIKERGCGSADHLAPSLAEHGFTRVQVIRALHHAARKGLLWSEGRINQKGLKRNTPRTTTYWPGTKPGGHYAQLVKEDKRKPERVLIASAWDWGTPQPESAWPKELQGRVCIPLGPWNSAEEAQEEIA